MVLVLLLIAAAPVPQHFEKVKDFSTQNNLGDYRWYGDSFFRLERVQEQGEAPPFLPAACQSALLELDGMATRKVSFPLGAWATRHPELFYGGAPTRINPHNGRTLGSVGCRDLVTYDGPRDAAGFLVHNTNGKLDATARERVFYVEWAAEPANTFHVALGELSGVHSVGQQGRRWYFAHAATTEPGPAKDLVLAAVDLESRARVEVATLKGARGGTWWPSPDFSAFLFIEYSEQSEKLEPPARLFVVSADGAQFQLPAPVSAYGVAWLQDQSAVFVGSNELGTLQRLDLKQKTMTPVARGHRGLQMLQLTPNGRTLLVMTRGPSVARYSLEPFNALPALPIKAFIPGASRYSWDWSAFSPDRRRLMSSRNKDEGTVNSVDSETPGVSLYNVTD